MRIRFITSSKIGDAVISSGIPGHLLKTNPNASWGRKCASVRTDTSYDDIFPSKDEIFKVGSLMGALDVDRVERNARELWQSRGK